MVPIWWAGADDRPMFGCLGGRLIAPASASSSLMSPPCTAYGPPKIASTETLPLSLTQRGIFVAAPVASMLAMLLHDQPTTRVWIAGGIVASLVAAVPRDGRVPFPHRRRCRRLEQEFVERVLTIVETVPRGRVTTYGAIADVVGSGPRLIGNVMARHGGPVPWWRVVRADGSLPPSHAENARGAYLEEGTPLRPSGDRVDLVAAFWQPRSEAGRRSPRPAAAPRPAAPR